MGNPISTQNFPVDYFTGDGTSTTFQLSYTPASASSILVHIGGVKQVSSTFNAAYYVDGSSLVFPTPPGAYSPIEVNYLGIYSQVNVPANQSITQNMLSLQLANTFVYQTTANGATASFTLNAPPVSANSLIVSANGVVQYDYSVNGTNLTFGFTPPVGTLVRITSLALAQAGVPSDGSVTSIKLGANLTLTGNTTFASFGGNAPRILGDFSNVTLANQVLFQTSTTNGSTQLRTIPNGTGPQTGFFFYDNPDTLNNAWTAIRIIYGSDSRLQSGITGTGTYLPLTMYTGGSERMRIDTSGNLLIGTTSGSYQLTVANDASISGLTVGKGGGAISTNTALGNFALNSNTSGSNNSIFGYQAGYNSTTGAANTAVGYRSLLSSTTSSYNTAIGFEAGKSVTTGNGWNTLIGYQAGFQITTGKGNTIVGGYAGSGLTTGSGNNFFGSRADGYGAGYTITTGAKNVIVGGFDGNSNGLDIRTASNYIVLSDGDGNPRQVINSSGNVGIGTSSPAQKLDVAGIIRSSLPGSSAIGGQLILNNTTGGFSDQTAITFQSAGGARGQILSNVDGGFGGSASLQFWTLSNTGATFSEKARIDSSGNLLVGTTSNFSAEKQCILFDGSTNNGIGLKDSGDASGAFYQIFRNGSNNIIGSITRVGTSNAIIYNTTSDYRLKTVVSPVTDAGTRLDALQPIEYDWKTGGRARGFLAHQFAGVYPNSVSGEKDAVDAKGKPVYQGMQASTPEVMADLIAEIQSLRKRVAQLESK